MNLNSLLCFLLLLASISAVQADLVRDIKDFKFLEPKDIKELSNEHPSSESLTSLERTLNSIFWANENRQKSETKPSKYLRVSHWNIERGLNIDLIKQIIQSPTDYLTNNLKPNIKTKELDEIKSEIDILRTSDIFMLNEVDWGIGRTNYKNIASEFAKIIGAEYVFATEFLELNPDLIETNEFYKGLHGNAIISKYPIKNARLLRLEPCYDWFSQELKNKAFIENIRRKTSKLTVKEEILTELRRGSRIALVADIELANHQTLTVISTHLENRCEPKCRERQMQAILDFIKTNKNPVILAGDFNNFENSAESTSIKRIVTRRISDPAYLIRTVATYFNPYGLTTNAASNTIGFARKYCDPTVRGIPIILPNKARGLFKLIQDFEFDDNNHFDFTGTKQFSSKARKGYLSNSNQRAKKGFVETFEFKRSFKVAKYKIDWIMVKPLRLAACHDYDFEDLDYRCKNYFPAFGKTLKDLNFSPKNLVSISDHSPVSLQIFCDHRTE